MTDFDELYQEYSASMEDFWSRRSDAPIFQHAIHIFGHPVEFESNHAHMLESATMAESLYSVAPWADEKPWRVTLVAHDARQAAGVPPERLIDHVHYAGAGDWLSIGLEAWGNCFVDMARCEAHAVLASSLADRPAQVSQVLVNTILTNFISRHGYGMLHASALVKDERLLLLMAPHGVGKSTTALRLLLNGYKLLSDSMVYVGEHNGALWLGGFPIGRIKLRQDMLAHFPILAPKAQLEPVRDEIKHRLDLDRLAPERTCSKMVRLQRVELCLLERGRQPGTKIEPLDQADLWREIMLNSLHYDTRELWRENLHNISLLLQYAHLHRLRIGTSEDAILKAVDNLWTSGD